MARKYFRKFKRIKKESQSSSIVLKIKHLLNNKKVKAGIMAFFIVALVVGLNLYNIYHKYSEYKILDSVKIDSGEGSKYVPFGDFVIKYSGDGISYINGKETVWTEAFEMKAPIVDVCGEYLAICDKNTNDIMIYNKNGRQGSITTNYPIVKIEVAQQGVVAALMEDKKADYIEVYDKSGTQLVSHKSLVNQNGYPLDFSLSDDGFKMAVSYLTVQGAIMNDKILFYNFSSVGKNSDERVVGEFKDYDGILVPTVQFVTNDDAIAIGENVLAIYKMKNTPVLKDKITFKEEIQKTFYNEEYVGMIFENSNSKYPYRLEVYNMSGSKVMETEIDSDFERFKFSGKNVVMYNDLDCQIISLKSVKKFKHNFKEEIREIIPLDEGRAYLFMMNSSIDKIRLK